MQKTAIITGIILFVFFACAAPRDLAVEEKEDPKGLEITENTEPEKEDTIEYELTIFDPGFERWFTRTAKPMSFYNEDQLARWNRNLTQQWNSMLGSSWLRDCMPNSYIDYRPNIDYGKELNYQLFYYFRYVHERCRIFRQTPGEWRN